MEWISDFYIQLTWVSPKARRIAQDLHEARTVQALERAAACVAQLIPMAAEPSGIAVADTCLEVRLKQHKGASPGQLGELSWGIAEEVFRCNCGNVRDLHLISKFGTLAVPRHGSRPNPWHCY